MPRPEIQRCDPGPNRSFAKWHELTRDRHALDFAVALANRLMHSDDGSGNDGALRPDGSFGGTAAASSASWHMHGHTHCLPRLVHLGGQLLEVGEREHGLRMIRQAAQTMDWLYDPSRNPDAGSQTGWLPEWLITATGWKRSRCRKELLNAESERAFVRCRSSRRAQGGNPLQVSGWPSRFRTLYWLGENWRRR